MSAPRSRLISLSASVHIEILIILREIYKSPYWHFSQFPYSFQEFHDPTDIPTDWQRRYSWPSCQQYLLAKSAWNIPREESSIAWCCFRATNRQVLGHGILSLLCRQHLAKLNMLFAISAQPMTPRRNIYDASNAIELKPLRNIGSTFIFIKFQGFFYYGWMNPVA
jgi:hypothetical protein